MSASPASIALAADPGVGAGETGGEFVIPAPPAPSLPVAGTARRFPVRRVYCVGRNYAAHAVEMGHDPDREDPFFFQKNPDGLVPGGGRFPYPAATSDVHHEVELVVALARGGAGIAVEDALSHVYGYAVGIDMTRRDLQAVAKKAGRPWEVAKAFEHAAPCSAVAPAAAVGHPDRGAVTLETNGEERQRGDLASSSGKYRRSSRTCPGSSPSRRATSSSPAPVRGRAGRARRSAAGEVESVGVIEVEVV